MSGIGFGSNATGGTATPTPVTTAKELRQALKNAANGAIIVINGKAKDYDFGEKDERQSIPITAQNLTIRAGANAVLRNVQFAIDLDTAGNIFIQDLVFRSDGFADNARDAITIEATRPADGATSSPTKSYIRITKCSFDGYYDVCIDAKTVVGRPRLFATIDHCLFFDARPGKKADRGQKDTFTNRGAINVATVAAASGGGQLLGDSCVTITNNVFLDVWRRTPRVDSGNFVHVYNNLMYRWGYTAAPQPQTEWRCIEVGGGNRPADDGRALIQANRFIPWAEKLNKAVETNAGTKVDLEGASARPNEFDAADGRPTTAQPPVPVIPADRTQSIDVSTLYSATELPNVVPVNLVSWSAVVDDAGSSVFEAAGELKTAVKNLLASAAV